jgi:predicted aspartyl protease
LILPERLALELRLAALPEHELVLVDGSVTRLPRYSAEVVWDERKRTVPVYASRGGPLIGMKCLRKHLVTMELIPEGSITIERAV